MISKDLDFFWYIIISLNDKNYLSQESERVKSATFSNNLGTRQELEDELQVEGRLGV